MLRRHEDIGRDDRLAHLGDLIERWQLRRVIDVQQFAVGLQHLVDHGRRAGDEVEPVLALEAFLHDLHVQETEEADAKAEAERGRHFRFVVERRIVEFELGERVAERLVVLGGHREQAGEDPRLDLLEARQRFGARRGLEGDRVADRRTVDLLDPGDDEADLARREFHTVGALGREAAKPRALVRPARGPDTDLLAALQPAVDDPHERDHADVVVEPGVDDQRLQRRLGIAGRRGDALDDLLEQQVDVETGLGRHVQRVVGRDADDLLDLLADPVGVGGRQVDLVQHRQDFQALVERRVAVGDALRLDALGGIDDQQRALAGGQRPRDLVGEVDVARCVDEVQLVIDAVPGAVAQRHALRLDGDAALALEVHRVEDLLLHFALLQAAAHLDQAVGQGRFAVVDVGDDREIANRRTNQGHARRNSRGRGARVAELYQLAPAGPGRPARSARRGTGSQQPRQLAEVEVARAGHQAVDQHDGHLVTITALGVRIGVDIPDLHVEGVLARPWQQFGEHFLAQRAVIAPDVDEPRAHQWALPAADSIAAAIRRTVSAGTSPMAVTCWPPTRSDIA